jgi:hypothetical protein
VSFAKFLFLPSWFAKLLEANFSCFAKITWMPSWFAKLLELLLDLDLASELCQTVGDELFFTLHSFLEVGKT